MELTFKNITNKIARLYSCYEPRVWVEPIAVAMIAALKKENPQIDIPNDYTKHMIEAKRSSGKNHAAVRQIQTRADVEKARDHLSSTIMKSIEASAHELADYKQYLNHMFSELLNNVTDHASSPVGGFAMAQYYPSHKKVQFAVADRGCGFLQNIEAKFPEITNEIEAITKAMEKSVTASCNEMYGQNRNAGYGLYTLQFILSQTKGSLLIISNDSFVCLQGEQIAKGQTDTPWHGTVVAFEFYQNNTDYTFEQIRNQWLQDDENEEEDFF